MQAAARDAAAGCSFQAPRPILLPHAYRGAAFVRKPDNRSTEMATLGKGVRVEISQSQCADFLTKEITFVVPRGQSPRRDDKAWLAWAGAEIGRLKLAPTAGDLRELQQFLLRAGDLAEQDGARSQCRDGSSAPAGQCSWDSTGGYVFRVTRERGSVRISATEYISG